MVLCALGFAIDLMEMALGGVLSAVFAAPPHRLTALPLGWLVSAVYVGAIAGAPLLGWIADRRGLARTLSATALWLAITSLLAVIGRTPEQLGAARLLSGLALGAFPPLMIAYLTQIAPPDRRGQMVMLVCALAYLAPPIMIFAVRGLGPAAPLGLEAWRWPFLTGAGLSVLVATGFAWAPEGAGWLTAKGHNERARRTLLRFEQSPRLLNARPERPAVSPPAPPAPPRIDAPATTPGRRFALVAGLYFLNPWATVGFPLLTGPILLARGFNLADTLLYVGLAAFGPSIGTVLGASVIDRLGRRSVMVACAGLMMAALALFQAAHSKLGLGAAVIGFGLFTALYMPTMTVFGAEQFPDASRSSATAGAWALNRLAASCAPMVLLPLLQAGRMAALMAIIAGALLAGMGLLMADRRR